jgi:hypothetical protein
MLLRLWREWHEGEPVQLQLSLEGVAENVASRLQKVKMPKVPVTSRTESAAPSAAIHGNSGWPSGLPTPAAADSMPRQNRRRPVKPDRLATLVELSKTLTLPKTFRLQ